MSVILDLRDERGRFFTKVKLEDSDYQALRLLAQLQSITIEELIHRAVIEWASREVRR